MRTLTASLLALIAVQAIAADAPPADATTPVATAPASTPPTATAPRTLSLQEAVQLSASVAPVGIARLDIAISHAGLGAERMALLPSLSATAGLTRAEAYQQYTDPSVRLGPGNIWDARLRVGQALIDAESWNRVAAAGSQLAVAEANVQLALEDAAEQAASAYLSLATTVALVQVRRQDLALAEELSSQAHARVDAGSAEGISATRADTRTETIRAQLVAAEGNAKRAAIVLARALNLDPATALTCTDPLSGGLVTSTAPAGIAEAETIALRSRPERSVSADTLAALESQYRAQRGARMPKLSAFADAGRAGAATDDTVGVWEAGLQLTIPLVNRTMYDQRGAEIRIEQQRLRATDLIARIQAEVNEAVVTNTSAQAALRAAETARTLAERQLTEARTRFAAGVAGNLDVVDAQVTFSQAQEQVVTAQNIAAQARIRLARAVGAAHTVR